MRRLPRLAVLLLAMVCLAADPPRSANGISLEVVKYDGLTQAIRRQKGKVVVVDFWADYCLPCKREFPKLVALQQKFGSDGLVAISVSLDDPQESGVMEKVRAFLESRKALIPNYILDERSAFWQKKLGVEGPPIVFVFGRTGELEQKFIDEVDYGKVESLVAELLRK